MFLLIITLISLYINITLSAEIVTPQSIRNDLSFSYKIRQFPTRTTRKRSYNNIQYAPLPLKLPEGESDIESTSTPLQIDNTEDYDARRQHIEPRLTNERVIYRANIDLTNVPAYNLQYKTSLDNEETFETLYKKNLNQYQKSLNDNDQMTEEENTEQKSKFRTSPPNINVLAKVKSSRPHPKEEQRYVKVLTAKESPDLQPFLVVKSPLLHLNIARSYHVANLSMKATIPFTIANLKKINNQMISHPVPHQKARIYPNANKIVYFKHSLP